MGLAVVSASSLALWNVIRRALRRFLAVVLEREEGF